ncbi:MAG TPA: ATP synthase F0 subunit B [Bryobacteraceae bacterium]|jgi:F-type H+-transporting ATPase subunit b
MKRLILPFLLASVICFAQEAPGAESSEPGMIWKVVNFAILAAFLGYLLVKNLPPFFISRTASIQKEITEAQKLKKESEERAAAILKRVSTLAADIEAFRVQAHSEMEREGQRIRDEAVIHIQKLNTQAQSEIESAGKTARRELRAYAADLALDLAGQRIRTRLDAGTEAGLVDRFVGDLQRQESKN